MITPEPQDKDIDICIFFDCDNAGDKVCCISRNGFLIYVNTVLVQWFSEKQSTVEASLSGTKFITMNQGVLSCNP